MQRWLRRLTGLFTRLSKLLSRKGLYQFLRHEYEGITSGSQVLSVGSGGEVNKILAEYASKAHFTVVSFDISAARHPDLLGDICVYDFGEQKFDVVIISEVLEHLYAPHLALQNIRGILKPGGKLVLTTPFILPIHEAPHDYYRYTRYGLAYLLQDFKDVVIQERNSWAEAVNILPVRLIREKRMSIRLVAVVFVIVAFLLFPFAWLLGKLVPSQIMTTGYVVTARGI